MYNLCDDESLVVDGLHNVDDTDSDNDWFGSIPIDSIEAPQQFDESSSDGANTDLSYKVDLNKNQLEAVNTVLGPLLILAGAGTGKTKTVVARMVHLVCSGHAAPHEILGLTFTNKASKEMKDRIGKYFDASSLRLGTFHSICSRFLRENHSSINLDPSFVIIDQSESEKEVAKAFVSLGIVAEPLERKVVKRIISELKEKCINYNDTIPPSVYSRVNNRFPEVYHNYQQSLITQGFLDFDDLILSTINMLQNVRSVRDKIQNYFKFVFVDEYQDTSSSQNKLIKLLIGSHNNICCVGDEDQSIYSWRGANIGNILDFANEFSSNEQKAKLIRLEDNYRSGRNIIATAMSVISNNKNRYVKTLKSTIDCDEKVKIICARNDIDECATLVKHARELNSLGTAFNRMAILVRASFQNRLLEESLNKACLPYRIVDGVKFYDRKEIRDVIAYLRIIYLPTDELSFDRIINIPRRGIGEKTTQEILSHSRSHSGNIISSLVTMLNEKTFGAKVSLEVENFVNQIVSWRDAVLENKVTISSLAEEVVNQTGYMDMLKTDAEKDVSFKDRVDNVREFIASLEDFANLQEFLEHVALLNAREENSAGDAISIMTIHAAKGLEFEVVFSLGWEDNVFPSSKSLESGSQDSIEEERRLAYVTITRAKKNLFISYAKSRMVFGRIQSNPPSTFVQEIRKFAPPDAFDVIYSESVDDSLDYNRNSSWRNSSGFNSDLHHSLNYDNSIASGGFDHRATKPFTGPSSFNHSSINPSSTSSDVFKPNDNVVHTVFGTGVVQKTMSHYAEVIFDSDGKRMLIHKKFLRK